MDSIVQTGLVRYRLATESDVSSLYALICELAVYEGKDLDTLPVTEDSLRRYGFEEGAPAFYAELAEMDGVLVGYALYFYTFSANQGQPILYLEDLYVKPEYRGRGIGRGFLDTLKAYASDKGCCRLEWHVFDWNEAAIAFYERLGGELRRDLVQVRWKCENNS